MKSFFRSMLHAGVVLSAIWKRIWESCEELVRSPAALALRDKGRFEALKRKEMELDRLDRLRHPSNYQGR